MINKIKFHSIIGWNIYVTIYPSIKNWLFKFTQKLKLYKFQSVKFYRSCKYKINNNMNKLEINHLV